jgi:hypothetical protein
MGTSRLNNKKRYTRKLNSHHKKHRKSHRNTRNTKYNKSYVYYPQYQEERKRYLQSQVGGVNNPMSLKEMQNYNSSLYPVSSSLVRNTIGNSNSDISQMQTGPKVLSQLNNNDMNNDNNTNSSLPSSLFTTSKASNYETLGLDEGEEDADELRKVQGSEESEGGEEGGEEDEMREDEMREDEMREDELREDQGDQQREEEGEREEGADEGDELRGDELRGDEEDQQREEDEGPYSDSDADKTHEQNIATAEYIINDIKKGFSKVGELTGLKSAVNNVKQHPITEQLNNLASSIGSVFKGATHGLRKSLGLTNSPTPLQQGQEEEQIQMNSNQMGGKRHKRRSNRSNIKKRITRRILRRRNKKTRRL